MITERYSVVVSIPVKGGNRAEAEFLLGDQRQALSLSQAQELQKTLKTAAAVGEVEMYVNVIQTKVNDSWKPE